MLQFAQGYDMARDAQKNVLLFLKWVARLKHIPSFNLSVVPLYLSIHNTCALTRLVERRS